MADLVAIKNIIKEGVELASEAGGPLRRESFEFLPGALRSKLRTVVASFRGAAGPGGVATGIGHVLEADAGSSWLYFDHKIPGNLMIKTGGHERHISTLEPNIVKGGYEFINSSHWPQLHELSQYSMHKDSAFRAGETTYNNLQHQFMQSSLAEPSIGKGPNWFFIQDFQLGGVPGELRTAIVQGKTKGIITHFAHTPFPSCDKVSPEYLPFMDKYVGSMIKGADFLGFQTPTWRQNFYTYAQLRFGSKPGFKFGEIGELPAIFSNNHATQLVARPLGIEPDWFARTAENKIDAKLMAQLPKGPFALSFERLDYTKGVDTRLQAIDLLFERYKHLKGKFSFVQVAFPTRKGLDKYDQEWELCESLAQKANRHASGDWMPVHWLKKEVPQELLPPIMRAADLRVVTPRMDGLNLGALEGVAAASPQNPGVQCLSEGAGAWNLIGPWCVRMVPTDVSQMADALYAAINMPGEERAVRHLSMSTAVRLNPTSKWASEFRELAEQKWSNTPHLTAILSPVILLSAYKVREKRANSA